MPSAGRRTARIGLRCASALPPRPLLAFSFGAFALVSNLMQFEIAARARRRNLKENPVTALYRTIRSNPRRYGGYTAHIGVLAMVGFITFDDIGQALLAPGAYVGLNILESYILTPLILGRRLTLNPVVIFLGLTFWGWLWGITGAILAVPIMVVLKIFCDHSETLASVGEFMGGE